MRLHVNLADRLDPRPFEVQSRLHHLDQRAIAQKHAALGLIDCVPAPEHDREHK